MSIADAGGLYIYTTTSAGVEVNISAEFSLEVVNGYIQLSNTGRVFDLTTGILSTVSGIHPPASFIPPSPSKGTFCRRHLFVRFQDFVCVGLTVHFC